MNAFIFFISWLLTHSLFAIPGANSFNACVDRVEDSWALLVTEQENEFAVALDSLPPGVKEGDCLCNGKMAAAVTSSNRNKVLRLLEELEAYGDTITEMSGER